MKGFTNENIKFDVLRQRAYNMRWAEQDADVIPLTAADHDFPCAPEVVQALQDYIKEGYFTYTPHRGFPSFKKAIAKAMKERKNEDVNPDFVLPIDSAARGMKVIADAVLQPGDEVIVFDPVDFLFRTSMESAGAKVILFPTNLQSDCVSLEGLEDYITPKTKMLGFCNPHNPMGMLYKKEDLDYLLRLSEKYGFYIMNDEIWSDMIYPECEFTSLLHFGAERNARTLTVYGFSKTFGLAGLRIGCVYTMNQEMYDRVVKASLVDTTIGGIDALSQIAGEAALKYGFPRVDAFRAQIAENRDYALARIEKMPGIKCHKPQATFVLFPDITGTGWDPVELIDVLKEKYRVALVPGGARFFGPGSEGHIRICLSTSREVLEEGLNRLEACLNDIASGKLNPQK
ncbi:MAG: pyridoxal phosphate-dependent aminotransferase [Firmicutes bacterium]|jgi:cystathionine beta-lyase|nr:pyridoxal phosphate-dependent aminotransferase [Bacillota bacterium]